MTFGAPMTRMGQVAFGEPPSRFARRTAATSSQLRISDADIGTQLYNGSSAGVGHQLCQVERVQL
jgi:hypothetical protein